MEIKKGKLNFDQSGRAYPDNPRVKENWDYIWEYEGKYYKLVGDNEHKEWDEVNIYKQIIDEVYLNFEKWYNEHSGKEDYTGYYIPTKEEFIRLIKTDSKFSEKWGLKIEERELSPKERIELAGGKIQDKYPALVEMSLRVCDERDIPTKLITITYNNETIESYE